MLIVKDELLKILVAGAAGAAIGSVVTHHCDKENDYAKSSQYNEVIRKQNDIANELIKKCEEFRCRIRELERENTELNIENKEIKHRFIEIINDVFGEDYDKTDIVFALFATESDGNNFFNVNVGSYEKISTRERSFESYINDKDDCYDDDFEDNFDDDDIDDDEDDFDDDDDDLYDEDLDDDWSDISLELDDDVDLIGSIRDIGDSIHDLILLSF